MKILTIGGTRFFGRAFVEEAARRGHEVTVFHRGESEPADLPDVEHLHGDRKDGRGLLGGRIVGRRPGHLRVRPAGGQGARGGDRRSRRPLHLVSSLSVHPDDLPVGANEDTPTHQPPDSRTRRT